MPDEQRVTPEVASPHFSCRRYDFESVACLVVEGELDISSVPELDRALRSTAAKLVVLDLRKLEFIDSSGARLLVATDARIRRSGGRFTVVRGPVEIEWLFGPRGIEWLFGLMGIDRQLELVGEPPAQAPAVPGPEAVLA